MNNVDMTAQEKKPTSWLEIIENLEKLIFYASLMVLPISILPLPWDITEFSMGLSLMFFAGLLLTIELVKLVWKGRILVPKGLVDTGLLALLGSIFLSTALSSSLPTSLFGFDFRLGSGFILTLLLFVYIYAARSFLFKPEEVLNGSRFLIIGTFGTAIFSIFSFFGMNILSFLSSFSTLFTTGLPIYSSSRVSSVIWGVSLLISIYFAAKSFNRKKLPYAFFAIVSSVVHLAAVMLFTLAQGWQIFALITVSVVGFCLYVAFKHQTKEAKSFSLLLYIFAGITSLVFFLSLIPPVRSFIGGTSQSLITQLTISSDTSLKIVTQALSEDLLRSVVGVGHDTFSIAYNQYRPLNDQTTIINSTNFTNANNQLFNILTNRGLLGLGIWIVLGYFLFRYVWSNFISNKLGKEEDTMMLMYDVLAVMLYVSSFFIYHTFLLTFLLVYVISMSVSIRNMIFKDKLEVYVFNWGLFTHSSGNANLRNMAMGVTVMFVTVGILFNIYSIRLGISAYNTIQAEKITTQGRENLQTLGEADKAKLLVDAANRYSTAIRYNSGNDILHRRASLIISQYLESLASQYNKTDNENEKKGLFDQIATYVEISVEEAKKATELAPKVYANWGARSSVYSKLVGLGLTSYTKSALTALQTSATLNPLNYEIYYNAAQLYILNNESDSAIRTLNQLFSINPDHIPSLILAGEVSMKDKDFTQAQRYFGDAKKVMEETSATSNDVYDYVSKKLKELETQSPKEVITTPSANKETQSAEENTSLEPSDEVSQ